MHSLRIAAESDDEFRSRAEWAGKIARILVEACLLVRELIERGEWNEQRLKAHPTVRIEFEQAIAIGRLGETLEVTKTKHWGAGPWGTDTEVSTGSFVGIDWARVSDHTWLAVVMRYTLR